MKLRQVAIVLAVVRGSISCGGCDDTGKSTRLIVLDADNLDPVCALIESPFPAQACASVWHINIGSSSNEVMVTADGYQARSVVVSPVRFTSCGESGGCNLVFMVKQ